MTRSDLINILDAFKKSRVKLVKDYRTEEPDLYRFMFMYQPTSSDMEAAMSRYMFQWLSQLPFIYQSVIIGEDMGDACLDNRNLDAFILAYRRLCERFIMDSMSESETKSHVLELMVTDSIAYLDKLLGVSETADARLQKLVYQNVKSKFIFDRLFNELKEKQNGLL